MRGMRMANIFQLCDAPCSASPRSFWFPAAPYHAGPWRAPSPRRTASVTAVPVWPSTAAWTSRSPPAHRFAPWPRAGWPSPAPCEATGTSSSLTTAAGSARFTPTFPSSTSPQEKWSADAPSSACPDPPGALRALISISRSRDAAGPRIRSRFSAAPPRDGILDAENPVDYQGRGCLAFPYTARTLSLIFSRGGACPVDFVSLGIW